MQYNDKITLVPYHEDKPVLIHVEEINDRDKRFLAIFSNGKMTKFGLAFPQIGTFIDHKNNTLKRNYIKRHARDLRTNDYKKAGYLSMFLLWNKPTLEESIKDFNQRIHVDDWSLPY